ncbi:MAG: DUF4134 family protein [Bacteroidota bacterium]
MTLRKLINSILLIFPTLAMAQDWDASGGAFSSWFNPLADLMMGIGAVLFALGAVKVYNNMQLGNGNPYSDSTNLFGGALMLIIVGGAIRAIFF